MSHHSLPRLGILISGRGTNLQAFIDACANAKIAAQISIVISNNPSAQGLQRATRAGIAVACVDHHDYADRESFDQALVDELQRHEVDLVVLAGFMRILTPVFITCFHGKLLNIHPSLLPKYPGLNTHQRALDAGDKEAGVTVHFVTQELDGGPPVLQARVAVESGDTAETLAARVIGFEHVIYLIAVRWILQHRLQLQAQGAILDGEPIPATGIAFTEEMRL